MSTKARSVEESASRQVDANAKAARADIELVNDRKQDIAAAFYDIGLALMRLKTPAAWRSLGHLSFASLCDLELELSPSQADRFIEVVKHFTIADARDLGVQKAAALADLLDATPGHHTTHAAIEHGIRLPNGKTLDPRVASVRAIEGAAKAIRAEQPAGKRGRHISAEDTRAGKALEKKLRAAGAKDASVHVLAGFAKHPARVRIEIDIDELETLAKSIHPRR